MKIKNKTSYRRLLLLDILVNLIGLGAMGVLLKQMTFGWIYLLFLVQTLACLLLAANALRQLFSQKAFNRGYIKRTDERYQVIQSKSREQGNQVMILFLGIVIGMESATLVLGGSGLNISLLEFAIFMVLANLTTIGLVRLWSARFF